VDSLYAESAYYRMLFAERTQDLPFYRRVTEGATEVLELGVGDGRVALPLAAEGRRMIGLERSESMLAALRERLAREASRVETHLGDTRTFRLGRRVSHVICPFNGIAHFHDDEALRAFFETVRAHLAPDGLFAFDVMIPDPSLLMGGASSVPWLRHPRTGAVCRLEERYAYEPLSKVLTITTSIIDRETEQSQLLTLSLRQISPEETLLLLDHHGFEVLERSTELGDALAYVCRAR
jgi:SAM-dependent methyltransferase